MNNNFDIQKKNILLYQEISTIPNNKESQQLSPILHPIYYNIINQNLNNNDQQERFFVLKNQNQFPINNLINSNYNALQSNIKHKTKKDIYGKGKEIQRLKKIPHFGEPYENLEIFIKLGKPEKKEIIELGEKYNKYFKKEIEKRIHPKFGRDQKRSKALAVWFFEDCKEFIIPWLKKIGSINETG